MLALAQISISNDNYFFKLYSFSSPVHFWFLFGHRESCVPLFVQLKQPSIFSPLSCSCSALKICTDAVESRRHAEDNIASPLLFSPKEFFLSLQTIFFHFFYLLSSPVPLQKSPNNHFFDKVSTVLFFSFTYFSYFSWVWRQILLFDFFFFRVWEKANSRVWRGRDWLIFAVRHEDGELLMHINFSFGHVTPHC